MKILIILASLMTLTSFAFAQDINAPEQKPLRKGPVAYDRCVDREFKESNKQIQHSEIMINRHGPMDPKGPMMGKGRQFRGGFREEGAIQKDCPLCGNHKKMMAKKSAEKRGGKFQNKLPRHQ